MFKDVSRSPQSKDNDVLYFLQQNYLKYKTPKANPLDPLQRTYLITRNKNSQSAYEDNKKCIRIRESIKKQLENERQSKIEQPPKAKRISFSKPRVFEGKSLISILNDTENNFSKLILTSSPIQRHKHRSSHIEQLVALQINHRIEQLNQPLLKQVSKSPKVYFNQQYKKSLSSFDFTQYNVKAIDSTPVNNRKSLKYSNISESSKADFNANTILNGWQTQADDEFLF